MDKEKMKEILQYLFRESRAADTKAAERSLSPGVFIPIEVIELKARAKAFNEAHNHIYRILTAAIDTNEGDYKTVQHTNILELEEIVKEHLQSGWLRFGGIVVAKVSNTNNSLLPAHYPETLYVQALFKLPSKDLTNVATDTPTLPE